MKVGIIGAGRWGRNLLRTFNDLTDVKWCADKADLSAIQRDYPKIKVTTNYKEILEDTETEAVVIAVPIRELSSVAIESLKAGKHVFLEKPMASTKEQAKEILENSKNKSLFVGYLFLYHPIYKIFKEISSIDPPIYIISYWNKMGSFDNDIILNLASHDISIICELFNQNPKKMTLTQKIGVVSEEDIVSLKLDFGDGRIGTININRVSPAKKKEIILITQKGRVLYWTDNHLFELNKQKRIFELVFENKEKILSIECKEFLKSVKENKPPYTDGYFGFKIINLIDSIQND